LDAKVSEAQIMQVLGVGRTVIWRTRAAYVEGGTEHALFDVQCFDQIAAKSLARNERHAEIGASQYANPHVSGAMVDHLDMVVLSAMEVDTEFNVNVLTGSNGVVRGASGGHCDTAQGARLAMIVAPSTRARLPLVLDRVGTIITPGRDIACVITDMGVAWNPLYSDLAPTGVAGLDIIDIHELKSRIERLTGVPRPAARPGRVVGLVEFRDGTIIDTVNAVS